MIARGKHRFTVQPKPASQFGQRRAFVVSLVAEPGIDVVPHDRQIRNGLRVLDQVPMDNIRLGVVPG